MFRDLNVGRLLQQHGTYLGPGHWFELPDTCFRLGYGCDETEFCIRVHRRWPDKVLLYVAEAKAFLAANP